MKIGELARRADVPIDTIRFYEREGVIPPPPRLASGYRDYAETDVQRLQFLQRAKRLGFTLAEIHELLGLWENRTTDMARFNRHAQAKLGDIDQRIAALQQVRTALEALVDACPGHGALQACPILAALSGDPP